MSFGGLFIIGLLDDDPPPSHTLLAGPNNQVITGLYLTARARNSNLPISCSRNNILSLDRLRKPWLFPIIGAFIII